MNNKSYNSFYMPRTKTLLIHELIKSKQWKGTKSALQAMDIKQVRAIFIRVRQEAFNNFIKKDKTNATLDK